MSNLVIREWNQKTIRQREDGYISATDMCKAECREFKAWYRTQKTKEYLQFKSEKLGMPIEKSVVNNFTTTQPQGSQALIEIQQGGNPEDQGTWIHPKVAIRLAQWISIPFADQVDEWVEELLVKGSVYLDNEVPKDYPSALRAAADAYEQKVLAEAKAEKAEAESDIAFNQLEEAEDTLTTYRAVLSEEVGLRIADVAKGLGIPRFGRNKLFEYLRSKDFIMKKPSSEPYQRRIDEELAFVTTYSIQTNSGEKPKQQAKLTFKGLTWLVKKLREDGYSVNTTPEAIWDQYSS